MNPFLGKSIRRKTKNTKYTQLFKGNMPCNIKHSLITIYNYEERIIKKFTVSHYKNIEPQNNSL